MQESNPSRDSWLRSAGSDWSGWSDHCARGHVHNIQVKFIIILASCSCSYAISYCFKTLAFSCHSIFTIFLTQLSSFWTRRPFRTVYNSHNLDKRKDDFEFGLLSLDFELIICQYSFFLNKRLPVVNIDFKLGPFLRIRPPWIRLEIIKVNQSIG